MFVNHCHALFLRSLCRVFTSKCNFEKTSLSFLNYIEKQFTLYSYDFYMFSSSVNHLVQKRRDTKYVLSAMLYTAQFRPPKTLLGSRRLSEGSTLLGYLYRNLNFHKQIHSLSLTQSRSICQNSYMTPKLSSPQMFFYICFSFLWAPLVSIF